MTVTAISVDSVTKSFRGEEVLKEISLSIKQGDFCVVVGPSGCGKSTLLDCIAGIHNIDTGDISINGVSVIGTPIETRELGYVFQEFEDTLFPHKTVAENVEFGLRQQEHPPEEAEIDRRVSEMLDLLSISETADNLPEELSGGQQQRVELARQIITERKVMLLDDPLADLDYKLQKRMELEMRRLHEDLDSTFLYVTHNQDQALKLADKLVVMNRGHIEQIGTPREVYENPQTAFVGRFVGDSNAFRGTVESVSDGRATITTSIGEVEGRTIDLPEVGTESLLLIRPENIELGDEADKKINTIKGNIVGRTYTGEITEYSIEIEGYSNDFIVVQPGSPTLETGTTVNVGWDKNDAIIFEQLSVHNEESIHSLLSE
ncbi:ABC transporter ATP-binding protein [Haladaptatus sp. CMAA 1911]|uniref:ABC transporter ATP-binding protein n=1 Tax=unclassified Haladaptatus TaxID=2622732 RepID=UPI00375508A4